VKKVVKKSAGPDSTIARLYPVKVHLSLTKPTHQHKSGFFTNKKNDIHEVCANVSMPIAGPQ
jgi:hypothetical protein